MVSNLINGQFPVLSENPENVVSQTPAEPSLTIATVILCLVGPFWLIYRLVHRILEASNLVPKRIERATE